MADLGQVIGTLLVSLAHARRMADEQTIAIAEYYRSNPLLQGLTVPRLRVPEFVAEFPVILEKVEDPVKPTPADPATIQSETISELIAAGKEIGPRITAKMADEWKPDLLQRVTNVYEEISRKGGEFGGSTREAVSREVEESLLKWLDDSGHGRRLEPKARDALISRIRKRVADVVLKDPGRPPQIAANVLTSEIKGNADPQSVTRLRLVVREEGLEWEEIKRPDGTTTAKLGPE